MKSRNTTARLMLGASLAALAVGALPAAGLAQTQGAPAGNVSVSDTSAVQDVIVVGARLAERSAIDRKKRAATTVDSIVADDVGQFPDKSAAEAIARLAGVALDVGDSGEAGGFTIRGQEADLIRVEVDGMTVLDNTTGNGGRNAQLNELSSDLIKSVDVIKGQTADMTPGGVGGTVRIEQRNGLDFREPLVRLNLQWQNSSLNNQWTPRINAIAAGKFLDGRLGLLFNATYDDGRTMQDFARVSDKEAGYVPYGDQDNSPEKSFVQPYDPIAAAVTDKDDCKNLSTSGINSRRNCYAQWEDFYPSLVRYGRGFRRDERLSLQLRADFRVSDNLTVFASFNPNTRDFYSKDFNLSIATPAGEIDNNGNNSRVNTRALAINENHFVTQYSMVRAGSPDAAGGPTISSLNYGTQVRDIVRSQEQNMYQTGADFWLGKWSGKARAQYGTAKAEREDWAFQYNAQLDSAVFSIIPESGVWTFEATPSDGADLTQPEAFYPRLNTSGISPTSQFDYIPQADKNSELAYQLDMTRDFDSGEAGIFTRFKWGIQRREFKSNTWREGGALELPGGVRQSRARSLDLIRACEAPAGSTLDCEYGSAPRPNRGVSDQLYKQHTLTPAQYKEMIDASLTPLPGSDFFAGVDGRGDLLRSWTVFDMKEMQRVLGQYADLSDWNLSCLYYCIADDGQTYKHNSYATKEVTSSAYAMLDFEGEMFGMDVLGNVGVRYQSIDVQAQTVLVGYDRVAVQFDDATGKGFRTQDTLAFNKEAVVDRSSTDVLPSFNLSVWPIEDKLAVRYSIAQQRARPSLGQLTGSSVVTCYNVDESQRDTVEAYLAANPGTFDDGDPDTDDSDAGTSFVESFVDRCSGRIGNPALQGYGALTQNISLEWYPNRDTQVTATAYKIAVDTGRPEGLDDPAYVIEGNPYEAATYEDGEGGKDTTGVEFAVKTAFTFLPGILRHTGGGFNTSTAKSTQSTADFDLVTGRFLPARSESSYYYNVNLWYDDGRINARVAYQARDYRFDRLEGESRNRAGPPDGGTGNYFKIIHPIFKSETKVLDARASYKLNDHLSFFVEGKNLLDDTVYRYTPNEYRQFDDEGTPFKYDMSYYGRKYYAGLIYTF